MNEGASASAFKDSPNPKELKKIKDMKAKLTKPEAKVVDDKPAGGEKGKSTYNKQISKEKVGKCPLCDSSTTMNRREVKLPARC